MKKIVILGPESTGKSILSISLCKHYHGFHVREYAREYLKSMPNQYLEEDLLQIAKGQILLEDKEEQKCRDNENSIIIYDTDLTVIKIWSEYKYGRCDPWILEQVQNRKYDLYLLTNPDLNWQPDPMRENPKDRSKIFELYLNDLESRNLDYRVISGIGEERTTRAIKAVNSIFQK